MIHTTPAEYVRAENHDAFLRIHFGGAAPATADFHYFWLRHNCDCCRHPLTRERILCSSEVSLEIRPLSVALSVDGAAVIVQWDERDGHRSEYQLAWLREHAYALDRVEVPPPSSDVKEIEVQAGGLPPGALRAVCKDYVQRFGAIVVRDAGTDTEALIADFSAGGWTVIETHFGRIEDLRTDNITNQNTDQLGYTDAPVHLHTDQPFLAEPPHYQMLHCMQSAEAGGENFFVDARQAAVCLRDVDAHAFELLCTIPVRFHRKQRAFERLQVSPVIECDDGAIVRIRSSYFTTAPHHLPFNQMEEWYRAYNRFATWVNDPRHQYRICLAAGDFLLYDNYRMLHARSGFVGARWVRGVYFNSCPADGPAPRFA